MKNLAILFGGRAAEYPISLISASNIIKECRSLEDYQIFRIGINKQGEFYEYLGPDDLIAQDKWQNDPKNICEISFQPGLVKGYLRHTRDTAEIQEVDVFFPVLHGLDGEGGPLQGFLDILGVDYVGCRQLAAACMMDKIVANILFDAAKLEQAVWCYFDTRIDDLDAEYVDQLIRDHRMHYPVFIKPANTGSSVGISRVNNYQALAQALELAAKYDHRILIEEAVFGRELEVAVLSTKADHITVSLPGEIIPGNEFYDYEDKYAEDSKSQLKIPANLPEEEILILQDLAAQAFIAGTCEGLARVDFFRRESDGAFLINEINTMPGFTAISMYPKLMEEIGLGGRELILKLIESASQ